MINFTNTFPYSRTFDTSRSFSAPNETLKSSRNRINPNDYILQEPLDKQRSPESFDSEPYKIEGFRFEVLGNVVHFKQSDKMEAIQDIYMKIINGELHFSIDAKKWSPFEELFSFDCNLNFLLNEGGNPTEVTVSFEVNSLS